MLAALHDGRCALSTNCIWSTDIVYSGLIAIPDNFCNLCMISSREAHRLTG